MKFKLRISGVLSLTLLTGMGVTMACADDTSPSAPQFVLAAAHDSPPAADEAELLGLWQGTLAIPGSPLRLVLSIEKQAAGGTGKSAYKATLTSPDQTPQPFPVTKIEFTGDILQWEVTSLGASYEGKANAAKTEIIGTFQQGGGAFPLTLKRVAKVQPAEKPKPKQQEPTRPYPYNEEEVTVSNKAQNVTLAGTLTLPRAKGPFPAVLLITGSGPQDRDEALLGHRPFLVLSDYLTRRGIAVLRVDDRGVGKSTGSFGAATSADFVTDAQACVAYLTSRKDIDAAQIGLIGHSEGGMIAPFVASQSPDIAFIVMMAGPGMRGDKLLLLQGDLITKAEGVPDAAFAQNHALRQRLIETVTSEPDAAKRQEKLDAIGADMKKQLTQADKKTIGDVDTFVKAQTQTLNSPWMRYFLAYDPQPMLQKVTCPVLAINGERDLQVPPKENLALVEAALKAGGNKDHTVRELPGLNHLFQTCKTGSPSEYAGIDETIAPLALQTMGDWIAQHTHKH